MPQPSKAQKPGLPVRVRRHDGERRGAARIDDARREREIARVDVVGDGRVAGPDVLRGDDEALGPARAQQRDGAQRFAHEAPRVAHTRARSVPGDAPSFSGGAPCQISGLHDGAAACRATDKYVGDSEPFSKSTIARPSSGRRQPALRTRRLAKNPSRPARRGSSLGRKLGSVRTSPSAVTHSASPPISSARDRNARHVRIAAQERCDLRFAFLGLQRAGAVDEPPARFQQRAGAIEHLRLHGRERADVADSLDPRDVGMAADRAGRRAGRIEQDRVEGRRVEGQAVADGDLDRKPEPLEVLGQPLHALG